MCLLLADLGELHRLSGEYAESEALCQRAIPALEKSFGAGPSVIAEPLSGHAKVLRKLKRKREAEELERRVKAIREQLTLGHGVLTVDVRELGKR